MKPLNESIIIVCGIVRDAEKGLSRNIPTINRICDAALDYKVVIFENSSKDSTKELLKTWAASRAEKVYVHCSDFEIDSDIELTPSANPFFSAKRIGKMVKLRNQYLEYIEQEGLSYDYLIVVDPDVSGSLTHIFLK